jgi:hypothetical protein
VVAAMIIYTLCFGFVTPCFIQRNQHHQHHPRQYP